MHTERKVYLFVQTCGGQRTAFRAFEKTPPIFFETGCLIVLELTNLAEQAEVADEFQESFSLYLASARVSNVCPHGEHSFSCL